MAVIGDTPRTTAGTIICSLGWAAAIVGIAKAIVVELDASTIV